MVTPSQTQDISYSTGTRATRFKAPEISPQELAIIDWFRRLSPTDQDELRGQYQQPRQPIGPVGLEALVRDYSRDLSLQGEAQNTVRVYAQDVGKFQRFLLLSERDVTEMGFELVCEYTRYLVGQGYKSKTVQLALEALRSFTRFLRCEGVLGLHQVPRPQDLKTKVPEDLPRVPNS